MIKEMKDLENSKPFIEEIESIKEEIQRKRDEKTKVGKGLNEVKPAMKKLNDELAERRKEEQARQQSKESF